MRTRFLSLVLVFLSSLSAASTPGQHALLVGVGDYPPESGWAKIHAQNDIRLVRTTLLEAGFPAPDIIVLQDAEATCQGIRSAFRRLAASLSAGDEVVVLFSCHGQQVEDGEGDEEDGLDEALIPYDAYIRQGWHGYRGDKHLVDDELNRWLWSIRNRIGPEGHLLVLLDACHSGDADRGDPEGDREMVRGTREILKTSKRPRRRAAVPYPRDWTCISACRDWQDNYEYAVDGAVYGRLSYAFGRCYRSGMTDDELRMAMQEMYRGLPPTRAGWTQELDFHVD